MPFVRLNTLIIKKRYAKYEKATSDFSICRTLRY